MLNTDLIGIEGLSFQASEKTDIEDENQNCRNDLSKRIISIYNNFQENCIKPHLMPFLERYREIKAKTELKLKFLIRAEIFTQLHSTLSHPTSGCLLRKQAPFI